MEESSLISTGAFALLGLGLIFGLKHAMEVDHVVISAVGLEQLDPNFFPGRALPSKI